MVNLLNDVLKGLCYLLLCFIFVIQMTAYDENLSALTQHDNTRIIPIHYVHNREWVLPTKVHIRVSTMCKNSALIKTVILKQMLLILHVAVTDLLTPICDN